MHRWLIIALATTVPAAAAFGATFHVDASAARPSGVHRRISDAVAAAGPGDTIVVAPGVYAHEDVPITTVPELPLDVRDRIGVDLMARHLYGG